MKNQNILNYSNSSIQQMLSIVLLKFEAYLYNG